MKHLLIDDFRTFSVDKICRDYESGVDVLKKERWDVLWLDHDLGCDKTGYDVITFLENHPDLRPKIVICISENPCGRDRINSVIKKMYGLIFDQRHIDALQKQRIEKSLKLQKSGKEWAMKLKIQKKLEKE